MVYIKNKTIIMNNNVDNQYFNLLKHIINNGVTKTDRTGTGTKSVFDYSMRFDMSEGFPLLTSKKMFTKGIIHELIWFLNGDTNIKYLVDNGVHIWDGDTYKNYNKTFFDEQYEIGSKTLLKYLSKEEFVDKIKTDDEFAKKWGELGPVYGKQWRKWETVGIDIQNMSDDKKEWSGECWNTKPIDQIQNLINDLTNNPDSRRLIVSAWNVGEIDEMTLPPCHYGFQCYTQEMNTFERKKYWCDSLGKSIHYAEDFTEVELDNMNIPSRKLSLKWNQRSVDTLLGLPFNIASYGFLLHLLAREVNMVPHELIFSGGDVHLYSNHIEQAKEQLTRETFKLCKLTLTNQISNSLRGLNINEFEISDYTSDKVLKAELSN